MMTATTSLMHIGNRIYEAASALIRYLVCKLNIRLFGSDRSSKNIKQKFSFVHLFNEKLSKGHKLYFLGSD